MKKILFLTLSVIISLISYADTFSCKVPGYDSEVSLVQRTYDSSNIGSFNVDLQCTKSFDKTVNVLLNVYDGVTKQFVTSVNGQVNGAIRVGHASVNGVEKNHPYIVKIDYVSCDR